MSNGTSVSPRKPKQIVLEESKVSTEQRATAPLPVPKTLAFVVASVVCSSFRKRDRKKECMEALPVPACAVCVRLTGTAPLPFPACAVCVCVVLARHASTATRSVRMAKEWRRTAPAMNTQTLADDRIPFYRRRASPAAQAVRGSLRHGVGRVLGSCFGLELAREASRPPGGLP